MSVCSKFEKQNADDLKPDLCEDDQHTVIQVQNIHISQCTLESRAHLRSIRKIRLMSPGVMGLHRVLKTDFVCNTKANAVIELLAKRMLKLQSIA